MIVSKAYHCYIIFLGMSNNHRKDFVHVDDEWKWRENKITSLLISSNITVLAFVIQLMKKLRIHDLRNKIKLKFKVPNMKRSAEIMKIKT